MKELKKSLKRIYTRFVVMTALVVFGAIAIAQGKKDQGVEPPPTRLAAVDDAGPITPQPIRSDENDITLAGFSEEVDPSLPDPQVADVLPPARAELSAAVESAPVEPDAWDDVAPQNVSQELPVDDDLGQAGYDQEQADDLGAELPPRRNPFRNAAASAQVEAADEPADDYGDLLDAPPLLPDTEEAPADDYYDDTADAALPPSDVQPVDAYDDLPAEEAYEPDTSYLEDPQPQDQADYEVPEYDAPAYDAPAYDAPADETAPANDSDYGRPAERQPLQSNARNRRATSQPFPQREQIEDRIVPSVEIARRSESLPAASGRPGPQSMEGPQTPSLTVQKVAPKEVQVGQPATFEIRVRNVGRVAADGIVIRDEIPAGTKFVDSRPKATRAGNGAIFWEVGSLPPGQDYNISVQVVPQTEGQVGSVATVSFQASASARTTSTKPALTLEHVGPKKVLVGEAVRFTIKLSNPGTGKASNVILEEDVPTGLSHSSGPKLEYEVGTINPGQTRHLELTLKAADAGRVINTLVARADGDLVVEDVTELEVVKPKLQVGIEGPARRYLERKATYSVSVANPGTAAAKNVELVARLPRSLKFVSTNNSGYYDQNLHAVIWSLEQLPAGEMGRAQFTAMPIEMGDFQIKAEGKAEMGLEASRELPIRVEGIAALLFTLQDQLDPIEVGGQTTYVVRVVNQGSKDATNVQIVAAVPEGMRPLSAQGPTTERIEGQQIVFSPIDRLPAKGEVSYKISVQGTAANDYRIRVQMTSDDIGSPVIKEESTRVYSD